MAGVTGDRFINNKVCFTRFIHLDKRPSGDTVREANTNEDSGPKQEIKDLKKPVVDLYLRNNWQKSIS